MLKARCVVLSALLMSLALGVQAQTSAPASAATETVKIGEQCGEPRALGLTANTKKLAVCFAGKWEPTPLKEVKKLVDSKHSYIAIYQVSDGSCIKEASTPSGNLTSYSEGKPLQVTSFMNIYQRVRCPKGT